VKSGTSKHLRASARRLASLRERAGAQWRHIARRAESAWSSPRGMLVRERVDAWRAQPLAGWIVLMGGILLMSLLIAALDRWDVPLANPGIIYLPLVAMVAYYWGWLFGAVAAVLQLACVYTFFTAPAGLAKTLTPRSVEQLVALAAVTAFMLAL